MLYIICFIVVVQLALGIYIKTEFSSNELENKVTGSDVAHEIIDTLGNDYYVVETTNSISDIVDNNRKTIRLSKDIYSKSSMYSLVTAGFLAFSTNTCYKKFNALNKFNNLFIVIGIIGYIFLLFNPVMSGFIFLVLILAQIYVFDDIKHINEDISNKYNLENDKDFKTVSLLNYTYFINLALFSMFNFLFSFLFGNKNN